MKEKRSPNNNEKIRSARPDTRDRKLQEKNGGRNLKARDINTKPPPDKLIINTLVNDTRNDENIAIEYVDDADGSVVAIASITTPKVGEKQAIGKLNENSSDMEIADESDAETMSSLGDSPMADDEKAEKIIGATVKLRKKKSTDGYAHALRSKPEKKSCNLHDKTSKDTPNRISKSTTKIPTDNLKNTKSLREPLSDPSEEADGQILKQYSGVGFLDEAAIGAQSLCSDDEAFNTEENDPQEDTSAALNQKIQEMEIRIKNLESELREVAALEIAIYSVVPEHGSSAHKVHTSARRLSRLYIYACKYWSQDKRATVARNTVSGLVLVSKSCGNDVSRLTFWLSNTVVLREIISQAFGSSCQSGALTQVFESSGVEKKSSPFKWKNSNGIRQSSKQSFIQFVDDWQETRTFTSALAKVESWIFSRIIESIWWQTLAANMQSPVDNSTANQGGAGNLLGPPPGDQKQGIFSVNLWTNAFRDAFKRLCPVRAGGHECGCLPVLARKVMEQCIGRLDVAMFNAILRESAHEIPTDPLSDPIVESKVLPIPAGDLSFGSGAQLKNSVGNWTRWLSDFLGMDADYYAQHDKKDSENDDKRNIDEPKCFPLLNSLSDLLMLPKDMLTDQKIRLEVCPLISLPLVKRILCNFSPDELCPDPVPGAVLEAINSECIIERRLSGESVSTFPCIASPIIYTPPSSSDIAEKVAEADINSQFSRSSSSVQRKGYTSDEELDELESCLDSVTDKSPPSSGGRVAKVVYDGANTRYDLLREVWQAT